MRVTGRCTYGRLDYTAHIPLPSHPSTPQDSRQTQSCQRNSHHSLVAKTATAHRVLFHHQRLPPPVSRPTPALTTSGQDPPPRSPHLLSHSVENSPSVNTILAYACKPSTIKLYSYKWSVFTKFAFQHDLPTTATHLQAVLQFISYLIKLSLLTPKVCLAAIIAYQPQDSEAALILRYPTLKAFSGVFPICALRCHLLLHNGLYPLFSTGFPVLRLNHLAPLQSISSLSRRSSSSPSPLPAELLNSQP